MSKYVMGNHVRVTDPSHHDFDQVGVVTDHARPRNWLVHDQPEVFIQFPNGSKPLPTQERHLILAIPPVTRTLNEMAEQSGLAAEEKADPGSLKSGDRVMVLGHVGMYGGRFGMIHSHSGAGASVQWLVRLEGNPVSMPFSEYELTLAPRKDIAEQEIDGDYVRGGEVRTVSSTGAEKGTKAERFDLLPVEALATVARHYAVGAEKYSAHNWRKGYEWSKSYAALQRHAGLFWGGQDNDEEMGTPHMAAVAFHALSLLTFMDEQRAFDDRYRAEAAQ